MKRGWITWDKAELPPAAFDARLAKVRQHLAAEDLPALVVYTDVWRSNQGRYLANFMPYWNRALLVIPRDSAPVLLCGLSPRVYPWIRSVTILEDIRPNMNLAKMCDENGWTKVGVLDLPQLPYDLSVPNGVDVPWSAIHPEPDEAELSMYRRAAKMAREILHAELPAAVGLVDHEFVGRLERKYRSAGVEDLGDPRDQRRHSAASAQRLDPYSTVLGVSSDGIPRPLGKNCRVGLSACRRASARRFKFQNRTSLGPLPI